MIPTTAYLTIEQAQVYFDERLNNDAWDDSSTVDKNVALKQATRLIDRLSFAGDKTDSAQANQFPRGGDTTIPDDIEIACCEIAYAILDDADLELDYESQRMSSETYGKVRAVYTSDLDNHILCGIPSIIAWRHLIPYLRGNETILLTRIS